MRLLVTAKAQFTEGELTMNTGNETTRRTAASTVPSHLSANAVQDISGALTTLLAGVFALYLKTKNFHWHMSGHTYAIITYYWTSMVSKFLQLPMRSPSACERWAVRLSIQSARSRACSAWPTTMPTM
jgi:hypothetical protein